MATTGYTGVMRRHHGRRIGPGAPPFVATVAIVARGDPRRRIARRAGKWRLHWLQRLRFQPLEGRSLVTRRPPTTGIMTLSPRPHDGGGLTRPTVASRWLQMATNGYSRPGTMGMPSPTTASPRAATGLSPWEPPWRAGQGQAANTMCLGRTGDNCDNGAISYPRSGPALEASNEPEAPV